MRIAVLAIVILVTACGPKQTVKGYREFVDTYIGDKADTLAASSFWGAPDKSHTFADGSSVMTYEKTRTYTSGGGTYTDYQTIYTYDGPYNSITVPVEKTNPIYTHNYSCTTTFKVSATGIIESVTFSGNDCTATERKDIPEAKQADQYLAIIQRGGAAITSKNYKKAIHEYSEAIQLDPNHAVGYFGRGTSYFHLANYKMALRDADKAISLDSSITDAYYLRCKTYLYLAQGQKALADCNESLRREPDNTYFMVSRGAAYWLLGDHDLARNEIARAHRLNPEVPSWQKLFHGFEKAYSPEGTQDPPATAATTDSAISPTESNKALADSYVETGGSHMMKQEYDQAITAFSAAIRSDPNNAAAYAGRGYSFSKTGKQEQAIRDLDESIRLAPTNAFTYGSRCMAHALMLQPEKALPDCNESLRLQPDQAGTLVARAFARWQLGDNEQAREDNEEARRLNPAIVPWADQVNWFKQKYREDGAGS